MYFPFLLCEAKSSQQVISRADRQAVRSSSMAVNAIIQLHRILGDDQASKLSGQILVFSVSHKNENVKIYGHYAITEGAEVTFYRHCIVSFTLGPGEDAGSRKRTYDFVREVSHKFYPAHLKRISDALAKMDEPRTLSMTSTNMSIEEEGESQNQNKWGLPDLRNLTLLPARSRKARWLSCGSRWQSKDGTAKNSWHS